MLIYKKVDSFNQNKFNMKNIVGNVWEWVFDWWSLDHYKGFYDNPVCHYKLIRIYFKDKLILYNYRKVH